MGSIFVSAPKTPLFNRSQLSDETDVLHKPTATHLAWTSNQSRACTTAMPRLCAPGCFISMFFIVIPCSDLPLSLVDITKKVKWSSS